MTDVDPRVEAAARAIAGENALESDRMAARLDARVALAAADAADLLRDRGRAVPLIEQALSDEGKPGFLEPDGLWTGRIAEAVFDALNGPPGLSGAS